MPTWISWLIVAAASLTSLAISTRSTGATVVGQVDVRGAFSIEEREERATTRSRRAGVAPPKRILSASLLGDELLLDLLDPSELVGVSYVIDWPDSTPDAGRVPQSIFRTSGTTEDVVSRAPDLVVFSAYNNALTFSQLTNLGLNLFVIQTPQTFAQLLVQWQRLGDAVGKSSTARRRIARAQDELDLIVQGAEARFEDRTDVAPSALLLQGMFSYGPETLQGDALRKAGYRNALGQVTGQLSPQLNIEQVLSLNPDYLFVAAGIDEPRPARPGDLLHFDQFRHLSSVRRGRVCAVPGSWMASISHHALKASRAYLDCAALVESNAPASFQPTRSTQP